MQACMNASMDTDLAVLSVTTNSWEQRLLASEWLGRKIIDIGTVSGLKHWFVSLCKAFQYAEYKLLPYRLMFMYKHKC